MSSEIEKIKKKIYDRLDSFNKEMVEIKELLKQLPQNGESEENRDDVETVLELLKAEIQGQLAENPKSNKIQGEKRLKRILRAYAQIKNLKNIADVEAIDHVRGEEEE